MPEEFIARGFSTQEKTELIFFVDYQPLGNKIDFQIRTSEDVTIFENSINGQFFNTPIILEPNTYYVAEITNKGNEELQIFDIGFLYASDFKEGDALIVPLETPLGLTGTYIWIAGVISGIVAVVLYFKDRKKK